MSHAGVIGDAILSQRVEFVKFEARHLLSICADLDSFAQNLERFSVAYTMMDGDLPLACGGVGQLHKGVAKAWAFVSWRAKPHALPLTRMARSMLLPACLELKIHRLECETPLDNIRNQRWIEAMRFRMPDTGEIKRFEFDGIRKHYGTNREDYVAYAMFF